MPAARRFVLLAAVFPAVHPPAMAGVAALIQSALGAGALDLVPVRPLAEMEPQVTELYRSRLQGVHERIKP